MRRNRNALLASLVIAFVVATSFSVILYPSNNPTLTIVKAEDSTAHFQDSINGTFGSYFLDNFTRDTTLNKSLWVINGNALSNAETNFPVSPVNRKDSVVTPNLTFSSTSGMGMSGVDTCFEATGIQSTSSYSHSFTAEASVYATEAHANAFAFGMTNPNATKGIAIFGNVNSTNQGYYGLQVASPEYNGSGWNWQPKPLLPNPAMNQTYVLSITMDLEGYATVGVGINGIFGPSFTMYIGSASYYLFLGQYEGYPNNGLGPNQAYWQWTGVSYSNASTSLYNVNFHVNNVPSGFLWGVTLGNITKYENTQCISIQVKNGIYTYALSQVSGYMVSPLSGSVRVNNSNVLIQVYYVNGDPPVVSAMSGYSLALFTSIAASVVVVAFTAYLFLRKKKKA
jgi:hypothetical protein